MSDHTITERQQYWLDHLKAAQDSDSTLVQYAEANSLKVKDLYQWKTALTKRGFWARPPSGFVSVSSSAPRSVCSLVLPNGFRLEFQGVLSSELIKTLVASASALS